MCNYFLCYLEDRFVVSVPDNLLKELADLRMYFARFLLKYEEELKKSSEAQKEFVQTVNNLLKRPHRRPIEMDSSFVVYFESFTDEEVSLFNIHYLKRFCQFFPKDIR